MVISQYEFALPGFALEQDICCEALFPVAEIKGPAFLGNPLLLLWKKLIEMGFSFVKVQLIRDHPPGTKTRGLEAILVRKGYDSTIIKEHLAMRRLSGQQSK